MTNVCDIQIVWDSNPTKTLKTYLQILQLRKNDSDYVNIHRTSQRGFWSVADFIVHLGLRGNVHDESEQDVDIFNYSIYGNVDLNQY